MRWIIPLASAIALGPTHPALAASGPAAVRGAVALWSDEQSYVEVRRLLNRWLHAQNDGRLGDYMALYAPAFQGIRRSGERTVTLDWGGWRRDRQRMFTRPMGCAPTS